MKASLKIAAASLLIAFSSAELLALYDYERSNNLGNDVANGNTLVNYDASSGEGVYGKGAYFEDGDMLLGPIANTPGYQESYTISSWINIDVDAGDMGTIMGYGPYGVDNQMNVFRAHRDDGLRSFWYANGLTGTGGLTRSVWHHTATTYDYTSGVRNIYLNSELYATKNQLSYQHNIQVTDVDIGAISEREYFKGYMDDTAMFDEALTQSQINDIMDGDFTEFGIVLASRRKTQHNIKGQ